MTDSFADVTADVFQTLGTSAVFKPAAGSDVFTRVVEERESTLVGDRARTPDETILLTCLRDDVGIPKVGDVFEIDGVDFTVDGYPEEVASDRHIIKVIVRD